MKPKYPIRRSFPHDSSLASITAALLVIGATANAQTNNYFGTTGALNGSVWSTNVAGPYTSALDSTGGAIINFGNTAPTITGATITVAGINATADATFSAIGGTISNQGSAVIPIDVAGGFTLNFAGQAFTTSATAGYIKNGLGTVALAGNTYAGGFTLNAGTVAIGGVNAMGDGGTLTINGGTIRSNSNTARDLTDKYDGGIVVAANFALGDPINNGMLTFSNGMALGNTTRTITANSTNVVSGVISGGPGVGITKQGSGAIILTNVLNTYNGPTAVNAGTLSFRTADADGASTYTFGAGTALGLGIGTGRFTEAEIIAAFAGTVPAGLPTVTIDAATNIAIDTTSGTGAAITTAIAATTRGLEKIDIGANLTLTGANQYSGRTVVGSGSAMIVNSLGNIGDANSNVGTNSTIDLRQSGRIDISTASSSNKNFNLIGSANIFPGNNSVTLSGTISTETAGTKTLTLGSNSPTNPHTFSGNITDGSGVLAVTKSTAARWVLTTSNSFSGGFSLGGGTLDVNQAAALGTGTFTISGGTLNTTTGSELTLSNNNPFNWTGNFTFTGTNDFNFGTGSVLISGNRAVTVSAGRLTIGGVVSAVTAVGWNKLGGGTLALTNTANTNSGRDTITTGVVEVSSMANFSAASSLGAQANNDGLWIAGGATLRYVGNADVSTNRGFTLTTSAGSIIESSGVGTLSFDTPANALLLTSAGNPIGLRGLVLGGTNTGNNTFGKPLANNTSGTTQLSVAFIAGASTVTLASVTGVLVGATISGTGIAGGTTITAIDPITRVVTLSANTSGVGAIDQAMTVAGVTNPSTLTKAGAGKWILSQSNTYTGATAINGGTLVITGASQSTSAITFSGGGVLGLDTATPVAAASAAVDFTGQTVLVTGPTGAPSYPLLTASSITGVPALAVAIPGYALQVVSNELRLVQTVSSSAYDTWKAANAPGSNPTDDTDGDGVSNAVEFVLGGTSLTNDLSKLPAVANSGANMTFTFQRAQSSIDPKTATLIEVGTDLATWNTAPSPYTVTDVALANNPGVTVAKDTSLGFDTITLTVPQSPDAKKFARLKVVITP